MRATASGSSALAPRPYTVSVGKATRRPARRRRAAASISAALGTDVILRVYCRRGWRKSEVRLQGVNCPAGTSDGGNIAESEARPERWPRSLAIFKKQGQTTSRNKFRNKFRTNCETNSNGSGQECPLHITSSCHLSSLLLLPAGCW